MPIENTANNQGINFGTPSFLDNMTTYTLMAWIYPDTIGFDGDYSYVISKYEVGTAGWGMFISDEDPPNLALGLLQRWAANGNVGDWWAADSITLGAWQHIAISYDNSTHLNDPLIYVNGVSKTVTEQITPTGGDIADDSGVDVWLGNRHDIDACFDGWYADTRIYDRIVSATEIADIAAQRAYTKYDYGLVFNPQLLSATGLQTFNGTALGGTNYIIDNITGTAGTPIASPTGRDDIYLAY